MAEGVSNQLVDNSFNRKFLSALESNTVAQKLSDIVQQAVLSTLNSKIDELIATIGQLRREIESKDIAISDLRNNNIQLTSKVQKLEMYIAELDSSSRRDNLIFTGLETSFADLVDGESTSSRMVQQVVRLCQEKLGCEIHPSDISAVQLIPIKTRSGSAQGGSQNQRMAVVRFTRRVVRDNIYAARMKLKTRNQFGQGAIFINEDLTADLRKIFSELRSRVKSKMLLGAWSRYNKLYVRKLDGSVKYITKMADVD
jgi:hypothetical protein